MNPREESHDDLETEMLRLTDACLNDTISDEELTRLDALVSHNPEAQRLYFQSLQQGLWLGSWATNAIDAGPSITEPEPSAVSSTDQSRAKSPVLGFLGRATAAMNRPVFWSICGVGLLFCCYAGVLLWNLRHGRGLNGTHSNDIAVAVLGDSQSVQWAKEMTPKAHGTSVRSGEPLKIESGLVELQLKQGTTLLIEGPADWSINGENSATLHVGKLVARVPKPAVGFTLETPTARIVDLGTEFNAQVDDSGQTIIHVIEGAVECGEQATAQKMERVTAGEARRIGRESVSGNLVVEKVPFEPALISIKERHRSSLDRWREASRKLQADSSLVAYYDFQNEDSVLKNVLADKLHGQITTERHKVPWTFGRWHGKRALAFGKEFATVAVADHPDLAPKDVRSIALWLRIDALPSKGFALIAGKGNFPKRSFGFWHHAYGQLLFGFGNTNGNQFGGQSPKRLSMNEWHFAVGVIESGELRLYLDGVMVQAQRYAGDIATDDAPLMLGRSREPSNPQPFTGAIDEFAIYNRALSAAEIEEMYRNGKPNR